MLKAIKHNQVFEQIKQVEKYYNILCKTNYKYKQEFTNILILDFGNNFRDNIVNLQTLLVNTSFKI